LRALLNTTQFYQNAPNDWRSSIQRAPSARVVFLRFTCNRSSLSRRSAGVLRVRGGCAPTAAVPGLRGRVRTRLRRGLLAPIRLRCGLLGTAAPTRMGNHERKGWMLSPTAGPAPAAPALAPRSRALRPYQGAVAPRDMTRTEDVVPPFAGRPTSADRRTRAGSRAPSRASSATRHPPAGAGDAGLPRTPVRSHAGVPVGQTNTIFRKGKGGASTLSGAERTCREKARCSLRMRQSRQTRSRSTTGTRRSAI
jgi:hypothetical protein